MPTCTNECRYTLTVLDTQINAILTEKTKLYVELKLPNCKRPKRTPKTSLSNAVWNKSYTFTSSLSGCISFELKKDAVLLGSCLGKVSIRIDELLRQSQNEASRLNLYNPGTVQAIGTISVRLLSLTQVDLAGPSGGGTSKPQPTLASLQSELQNIKLSLKPSAVRPQETLEPVDTSGLQALERLCSKLDRIKLEKLKPLIEVMDIAAKIHPCVESTWMIASSLYRVCQKKAKMDEEVTELLESMDELLSFVDNVDTLKEKLKYLLDTIETCLRAIGECCQSIREYLECNTIGQTWKVFTSSRQLSDYRSQFKEISDKLDRSTGVYTAVAVNQIREEQVKATEALGRIETKISSNPPPSLTKILNTMSPPLPTDIFTGREDYLKKMEAIFRFPTSSVEMKKQRVLVLYGTGGMGKTHLALKFLDLYCERFTSQYMIDASSNSTIEDSFTNIGRDAGIPDANSRKTLQWLSQKREDWVLFFDNADDPSVILRSFFPNSRHGNIIITTRNADYETLGPSLEVSTLEESTAVSLLFQSSRLEETEENKEVALRIVEEFGCLALAIVQAGSYIRTRRISLRKYEDLYQKSRRSLLNTALGPDVAYARPVHATWEISFSALSVLAQNTLNICSFFYREGITEELFRYAVTSPPPGVAAGDRLEELPLEDRFGNPLAPLICLLSHLRDGNGELDSVSLFNTMHELRSYSLIQEPFEGTFSFHPLVHAWARERQDRELWLASRSSALRLLCRRHQIESMDKEAVKRIAPHFIFCDAFMRKERMQFIAWLHYLSNSGSTSS